jgi:hypothetical protein
VERKANGIVMINKREKHKNNVSIFYLINNFLIIFKERYIRMIDIILIFVLKIHLKVFKNKNNIYYKKKSIFKM